MRIEVATAEGTPTNEKGDLLEKLAADFLQTQSYEVDTQIRVTSSELDLLCSHRINKRTVYVECKAHRDPLSADVLKNLLGTITFRSYQEGWLISTGPLGKDAKGFQKDWEDKPSPELQKLSIYTPDRVLQALVSANVIRPAPQAAALDLLGSEDLLGDWLLLITPYGRCWVATCLSGGVPEGVLVYSAKTAQLITDQSWLKNIASTDTSLRGLDFEHVARLKKPVGDLDGLTRFKPVVEVQSGDSWSDYRPARPQDFVGRQHTQSQIIHFLGSVSEHMTRTRVFAITGNSGVGKSSLIAKLRERLAGKRYKRKYFLFAVDVRAATDGSYILSSLLSCLRSAAGQGFGTTDTNGLRISNPFEPLEDASIKRFLDALEQQQQIVCLIFDQFEELYSKPELFQVFQIAQNLFLSATSAQSNLVLGFAWKSDSTVQQSHPAYFMWHNLADHRLEIELGRFSHSEASEAITVFERELGERLLPSLRRHLVENSQGHPWLLKKLSIHVYEQIHAGVSQSELMDKALDVQSLFERDLQKLTQAERICLKLIAESAPSDWYRVLEASDQNVLSALLNKRLVVRSGDRLNLYWDIFREYVLTQRVPFIPLTYLPTYPSVRTMLMVAQHLDLKTALSYAELGRLVNINESTVDNVVRDLTMFGVATGSHSQAKLDERMTSSDPECVLQRLRRELARHALTGSLYRHAGDWITDEDIVALVKGINPAAQHQERTWQAYADRMKKLLLATGYLARDENGCKVEDQGKVNADFTKISAGYRKQDRTFTGDTSPARTVQALEWLIANSPKTWREFESAGHRNGATLLRNLRLIVNAKGTYRVAGSVELESRTPAEIVWHAAANDPVLQRTTEYVRRHPWVNGIAIGEFVNREYQRNWSLASITRSGNSIRQWCEWIIAGLDSGNVPTPLGRRHSATAQADGHQLRFFEARSEAYTD